MIRPVQTPVPLRLLSLILISPFVLFLFFRFVPSSEPFIIGRLASWNALVFFMPGILLYLLSRYKRIVFHYSLLSQVLMMFLVYLSLHSILTGYYLQMLTPLGLLFYLILFSQMSHEKENLKDLVLKISPFLVAWGLTFSFLSRYPVFSFLDLFGHPHFTGSWLLLFLPLLLTELNLSKGRILRSVFTGSVLAGAILFLSCFAQSHFLCLLALCNVSVFFYHKAPRAYKRFLVWFFIIAACAFVFFQRADLLRSIKDRLFIWQLCLQEWNNVPFFGKGMGNFECYYANMLNTKLFKTPFLFENTRTIGVEWAHNEFLHSFVEYGIPGLVLALALCFLTLYQYVFFNNMKDRFFYLGLVNLLLYSFVSFPFRMPCSGIFSFLFLSLLALENTEKTFLVIKFDLKKSANYLFLETAVLFMLGLVILNYRNTAGLYFFSKAVRQTPILKTSWLEKSVQYDPHSKLYSFALGKAYLNSGRFQEAEYAFEKSVQIVPHYACLFGLAVSKDLLGKTEQAKDLYERVKRIAPDFYPASHNLDVLLKRVSLENFKRDNQ
ncbi:MAG: O-antigen ligase family protein [Candidatus Aureabacteria bacterium]|nr:O-antigen ligase family protein [Candidatus Auribacterota bacterium]